MLKHALELTGTFLNLYWFQVSEKNKNALSRVDVVILSEKRVVMMICRDIRHGHFFRLEKIGPFLEVQMENSSFGFTMTVVGLGGTFITLTILILFVEGLKRVFPFNPEKDN